MAYGVTARRIFSIMPHRPSSPGGNRAQSSRQSYRAGSQICRQVRFPVSGAAVFAAPNDDHPKARFLVNAAVRRNRSSALGRGPAFQLGRAAASEDGLRPGHPHGRSGRAGLCDARFNLPGLGPTGFPSGSSNIDSGRFPLRSPLRSRLPAFWDWRPSPAESSRPPCRPAKLRTLAYRRFFRETPDPERGFWSDAALSRPFCVDRGSNPISAGCGTQPICEIQTLHEGVRSLPYFNRAFFLGAEVTSNPKQSLCHRS